MFVDECIEDDRWGQWWCVQRVAPDEYPNIYRVVDATPDCGVTVVALGKSPIDACMKALETVKR